LLAATAVSFARPPFPLPIRRAVVRAPPPSFPLFLSLLRLALDAIGILRLRASMSPVANATSGVAVNVHS